VVLYSDKSPVTDDGSAVQVAIVSGGGGGGGGGGDASAANQLILNDSIGAADVDAASSDTANTGGLIALFKRLLQRFTTLLGVLPATRGVQTPTNSLSVAASLPVATSATIATLQTANPGSGYATFSSATCSSLEIFNNTGTAIEYRRGGTGSTFPILNGTSRLIIAIANANEISIRRVDQSNTQVTANAEIFV